MAVQPSARPDDSSAFFADGRANRPLIAETIARGHLRTDTHLFTGKRSKEFVAAGNAALLVGGAASASNGLLLTPFAFQESREFVVTMPFPVTKSVLEHGRNRFMIYCVVCHDALGTGHGTIVERGYTEPPSYHIERLRQVPVGHIFSVITHGYGSMPKYGPQIPPRDRWAIVAYVRALQLSQHFPADAMTADMKGEMDKLKAGRGERP